MELQAITERNFLYLPADMPLKHARPLLEISSASRCIIERGFRASMYYLFPTGVLRYLLKGQPDEATLLQALNLHEKETSPIADSALAADRAPDVCVVLDEGVLIGYYDVNELPPTASQFRGEELQRSAKESPAGEAALERFLAAEFPDVLALGESATLEVYLTSFAAGGQGKIIQQPAGTPIRILVQARSGFEPLGEVEGTLVVTADEIGPRLPFPFKAVEAGVGQLVVLAYLNGAEVSRVRVTCEVKPALAADETPAPVLHQGGIETSLAAHPDLLVHIEETGSGERLEFTFTLTAADPDLNLNLARFGPHRLGPNPLQYFDGLYQEIENLGIQTAAQRQQAEETLKARGVELFKAMLPPEMQKLLWSLRGRIRSVFIQTAEPWVPWELCRLVGDEDGAVVEGDFFCEAFELTRWVPGIGLRQRLRMDRLAVVAPGSSGLDSAAQEVQFLRSLADGGRRVHPIPARFFDLHSAFKRGEYDVWHFSGHGKARDADPNRSFIELEDARYTAQYIQGEAANLGRLHPLVFLNACEIGRSGQSFAGEGGWARQFLRSGASAFVGALWSVYDVPAFRFAKEFYTQLLGGVPIGKAARQARLAIKSAGDPSWLAYTVFAYPLAKVA